MNRLALKLMRDLRMEEPLKAILESSQNRKSAYARFVSTVDRCIDDELKHNRLGFREKPFARRGYPLNKMEWTPRGLETYPVKRSVSMQAAYVFRKYYGIGAEQKSSSKIAQELGVTIACVEQYRNTVLYTLRRFRKEDIWYGTL
jgi:hypothetical protein